MDCTTSGNHIKDMAGLIGGYVDFPAKLADIGDAVGAHLRHAEIEGLRRAEREGRA